MNGLGDLQAAGANAVVIASRILAYLPQAPRASGPRTLGLAVVPPKRPPACTTTGVTVYYQAAVAPSTGSISAKIGFISIVLSATGISAPQPATAGYRGLNMF
jgi:hypothetical protein